VVQGQRKIVAAAMPEAPGPEYFSEQPPTPLLDTINYPIHMKNLTIRVCLTNPIAAFSRLTTSMQEFQFCHPCLLFR
jgi:hypothetical protein